MKNIDKYIELSGEFLTEYMPEDIVGTSAEIAFIGEHVCEAYESVSVYDLQCTMQRISESFAN